MRGSAGEFERIQRQSPLHRIDIVGESGEFGLYLNDVLRVASTDEHRIHECFTIPAYVSRPGYRTARVAVLRGGTGLAARELVHLPGTRQITVVEPDPVLLTLGSEALLARQNGNALRSEKVGSYARSIERFVQSPENRMAYDVLYVDMPYPGEPAAASWFDAAHLAQLAETVKGDGALVVRTPPGAAFGVARQQLERLLRYVAPYRVWTDSVGWSMFLMASRVIVTRFIQRVPVWTRYLDEVTLRAAFVFGKDERV